MSEVEARVLDGLTMCEQWKDIRGFEGVYQISTQGRVRRFWPSSAHGYKVLNPWIDRKTGYRRVDLCVNRSKDVRRIHQLVLEAFTGPRQPLMEGRHLDGNRQNNHLDNLRWGTRSENQQDRKLHGTDSRGTGNTKLTVDQVREIKQLLQSDNKTHRKIADMFGVNRSTITDINTGKRWGYVQ